THKTSEEESRLSERTSLINASKWGLAAAKSCCMNCGPNKPFSPVFIADPVRRPERRSGPSRGSETERVGEVDIQCSKAEGRLEIAHRFNNPKATSFKQTAMCRPYQSSGRLAGLPLGADCMLR